YIYEKDTSKVQDHIVVLGPNYQFRGNTRYLFNYLAKHNSKTPVYFITKDVKGPNFLTPETKETVKMIESAKVVILEDLIPSDLQPNGKI
ncbi:teichoic acid biosynthesis protein F, partial [Staphylococcus haemolyticus]